MQYNPREFRNILAIDSLIVVTSTIYRRCEREYKSIK